MEHQVKIDVNLETKIKELLLVGKKIEAIAAVQNQMKIGLKNSKDIVDSLEETLNLGQSATRAEKINL